MEIFAQKLGLCIGLAICAYVIYLTRWRGKNE